MTPHATLIIQWLCMADDCDGGRIEEDGPVVSCTGCGRDYLTDPHSEEAELISDPEPGIADATVNPSYL